MKESAVVQGLKSLASRLHPQLPLSPRESQRLLETLTTSFRRHLDQSHPQVAEDGSKQKPTSRSSLRSREEPLGPSSEVYADRHLASVLTSPLFAKPEIRPKWNYESVQAELLKNPSKDPISFLEEQQGTDRTAIPIVILCLKAYRTAIDGMSAPDRAAYINESSAGSRALRWLLRSELYKTTSTKDDLYLAANLAFTLVREGREDVLWRWLESDGDVKLPQASTSPAQPESRLTHVSRWKAFALRGIISAKLELRQTASADSALDAFFQAWEVSLAQRSKTPSTHAFPLGPAATKICNFLTKNPELAKDTDPSRFNKFVSTFRAVFGKTGLADFNSAALSLVHPLTPTPLPALQLLRGLFHARSSNEKLRDMLEDPQSQPQGRMFNGFMTRAASQLRLIGQAEDAEWVTALSRRLYLKEDPVPIDAVKATAPERKPSQRELDVDEASYVLGHRHIPFGSLT